MSYSNKGILNHQNGKTLPPSKTPNQGDGDFDTFSLPIATSLTS